MQNTRLCVVLLSGEPVLEIIVVPKTSSLSGNNLTSLLAKIPKLRTRNNNSNTKSKRMCVATNVLSSTPSKYHTMKRSKTSILPNAKTGESSSSDTEILVGHYWPRRIKANGRKEEKRTKKSCCHRRKHRLQTQPSKTPMSNALLQGPINVKAPQVSAIRDTTNCRLQPNSKKGLENAVSIPTFAIFR